jgi:hypothetical protein
MLDERESEILFEKWPTNAVQPLTMQESIPGTTRSWSTKHYSSIPPPRSKTCFEEKKKEEGLTGNHGGRQVGTCSAHGKEGARAVRTGPSPRKASRRRKRRRLWRWNLHPSPSGSECRRRRRFEVARGRILKSSSPPLLSQLAVFPLHHSTFCRLTQNKMQQKLISISNNCGDVPKTFICQIEYF